MFYVNSANVAKSATWSGKFFSSTKNSAIPANSVTSPFNVQTVERQQRQLGLLKHSMLEAQDESFVIVFFSESTCFLNNRREIQDVINIFIDSPFIFQTDDLHSIYLFHR